jgi:hypothetical protein
MFHSQSLLVAANVYFMVGQKIDNDCLLFGYIFTYVSRIGSSPGSCKCRIIYLLLLFLNNDNG